MGRPAKPYEHYIEPEPNSGCWLWVGSRFRPLFGAVGYGKLRRGAKQVEAHRVVYESERGPIPPGLTLDHLCRNRCCVNPTHLEPITRGQNVLRGESFSAVNIRKTHCIRGHAFEGGNVRYFYSNNGGQHRGCRACEHLRYSRSRTALLTEKVVGVEADRLVGGE